jgi:hypothetical protein
MSIAFIVLYRLWFTQFLNYFWFLQKEQYIAIWYPALSDPPGTHTATIPLHPVPGDPWHLLPW